MPKSQCAFWENDYMTMQIAIRARDGFVLAGDLSMRHAIPDDCKSSASYASYESKIRINKARQIALAIAEGEDDEADTLKQLDEYLANATPQADLIQELSTWSRSLQHSLCPSILVVNPSNYPLTTRRIYGKVFA